MNSFREQKREARRQLHDVMSELVLYKPFANAMPKTISVRLHFEFADLGELRRAGFAEREEQVPHIIFLREQVELGMHAIVVTDSQGAFAIRQISPPNDITVKATVTPLPVTKYAEWGLTSSKPFCGLPPPKKVE